MVEACATYLSLEIHNLEVGITIMERNLLNCICYCKRVTLILDKIYQTGKVFSHLSHLANNQRPFAPLLVNFFKDPTILTKSKFNHILICKSETYIDPY